MQQAASPPRTSPHLAGVIVAAIVVIVSIHLAGFHFVVAAGR